MRPRCQPLRFICIPNERIMPEHTCFAFAMCLVPLGRRVCKLHQVGTNYTLPAPIFNVVEVAAFASEIILVTTRKIHLLTVYWMGSVCTTLHLARIGFFKSHRKESIR